MSVVALERGGGAELMLPGRVEFAPGAEAVVDAPLPGTVLQVHVGPGTPVGGVTIRPLPTRSQPVPLAEPIPAPRPGAAAPENATSRPAAD